MGVGVAVDLLDDEDFEHKDGIIGFAADFGRMEGGKDLFEGMPINKLIDAREDVFGKILVYEMFSDSKLSVIFLEH